ncbi:hypothetical protein SGPA1_50811 [Streptomyces misionensis JCM 4497]
MPVVGLSRCRETLTGPCPPARDSRYAQLQIPVPHPGVHPALPRHGRADGRPDRRRARPRHPRLPGHRLPAAVGGEHVRALARPGPRRHRPVVRRRPAAAAYGPVRDRAGLRGRYGAPGAARTAGRRALRDAAGAGPGGVAGRRGPLGAAQRDPHQGRLSARAFAVQHDERPDADRRVRHRRRAAGRAAAPRVPPPVGGPLPGVGGRPAPRPVRPPAAHRGPPVRRGHLARQRRAVVVARAPPHLPGPVDPQRPGGRLRVPVRVVRPARRRHPVRLRGVRDVRRGRDGGPAAAAPGAARARHAAAARPRGAVPGVRRAPRAAGRGGVRDHRLRRLRREPRAAGAADGADPRGTRRAGARTALLRDADHAGRERGPGRRGGAADLARHRDGGDGGGLGVRDAGAGRGGPPYPRRRAYAGGDSDCSAQMTLPVGV